MQGYGTCKVHWIGYLDLNDKNKEKKEKNSSRGDSRFVYHSPNTWNNMTIDDESSGRASRWSDIRKPHSTVFVKFRLMRNRKRSSSWWNVGQFPTLATNIELPRKLIMFIQIPYEISWLAHQPMHTHKIVYIKTFKIAPTCFDHAIIIIIIMELRCSFLKLHC
jgi:hypothetical protein